MTHDMTHEQIAKGLTKGAVAALLQFPCIKDHEILWEEPGDHVVTQELFKAGLVGTILIQGMRAIDLQPLGLAVRAILEKQDDQ